MGAGPSSARTNINTKRRHALLDVEHHVDERSDDRSSRNNTTTCVISLRKRENDNLTQPPRDAGVILPNNRIYI